MSKVSGGRLGGVPVGPLAAVVTGALVAGLAVFAPGFDAQQTPVDTGTVWALNGDGVRYARVNAEVGELDTVKLAENPNSIVQTPDAVFVYTDGNSKVTVVDAATPVDISDSTPGIQNTPTGTDAVVSSGDFIAYLTSGGEVFATRAAAGADVSPVTSEASAEEDAEPYIADVIAVDPGGILYSYSATNQTVLRYSIQTGQVVGEDEVANGPEGAGSLQLTAVGGTWALLDPQSSQLWIRGQQPATVEGVDPYLQAPASSGDSVLVAHTEGLTSVSLADATSVVLHSAQGTPTVPVVVGAVTHAAWLPEGDGPGILWSSTGGEVDLDYGGLSLQDEAEPKFQVNGARAILNEVNAGWVWTVPDGALLPSSLDWAQGDSAGDQQETLAAEPPRVLELKPPVAAADRFGVRAGALVRLPVLLNDSDPNEDVLTVVPASIEGLDPSFGTVSLTNNQQELAVSVVPGASGVATFSYSVTDGTVPDGLVSPATTVTLTVFGPEVNNAPEWCGVPGCLTEWPTPQVVPGGTASVDVMRGWVDPEGDQIFVASAANPANVGTAIPTAGGRVAYQHPDSNSSAGATVPITVRVSDVLGASAEQDLVISVTPTPNLRTEQFTVAAQFGEPVVIDPRPFISGATTSLRLAGARTLTGDAAEVEVNSAEVTFRLNPPAPGSYIIEYTVVDEIAEETGIVRVTILDSAAAQVTTAPVVAFVRSKEDTTVDVLGAVSNPAGRVLLISGVEASAESNARLAVDIVGQSLLRVSGGTDSGEPGLLGVVRYTVSDGSGNLAATAQGIASIYLVDSSTITAPIAVDDTATVRVGGQVDIPVLANDLSAGGGTLALDPASVASPEAGGLAFAAGPVVRFVAPEVQGTYEVFYTAYASTAPELQDTARITITVTDAAGNAAPQPRGLTGRVSSGQSVAIEFDPAGVDPDGDRVILNRISVQPSSGSAAIAADGRSIVYTSVSGFQGQVDFEYEVRDPQGETAAASIRVGVIDAEADPRPVTYSDYLQVKQGSASTATLDPRLNDYNPRGGTLELIELIPDAQPGTEEFARLESLVVERDFENGVITFRGSDDLGPQSFIYTVANDTGDTAQGFIVLSTVRATVADLPVISDTILTATTRDQFASGVDVLSGKVVWNSGDPAELSLALWRETPGVSVQGSRIRGSLPQTTLIIPFSVTGPNYLGEEVTSYGLLTVLGEDELRLTLTDPSEEQVVDEKGETSFDLANLVDYVGSAGLEIDAAGVVASGRRAAASCEATSGTTVIYRAGAEAPWNDTCTVPVRIIGQTYYTYLSVQIRVISEDPQPELTSAALTVSPGATSVYDLADMTSWTGRPGTEAIAYEINYTGTQFRVSLQGEQVTVVGIDNSRPGTEERTSVSITNYDGVVSAPIILQVGLAPSTLPKGATVVQRCGQASGTSCSIPVIGAAGEVNPLPGTPLTLVSVESPTTCPGVAFAVSGSSVTASWTEDTAGATCEGSFVVADAQSRQTSAERNGTVILDLQGFPKAPNSVTQVAYTADSVTLRVDPGASTSAYPALTGFTVSGGGKSVSCAASGVCPPITGLENGEQIEYSAVAVNPEGNSLSAVSAIAWAYRPPLAPTVTAAAGYRADLTTASQGAIDLEIRTSDDADGTASYVVNGSPLLRSAGEATLTTIPAPVGDQTVSVEAISRFSLPAGTGPVGSSSTGTSNAVTAVGLPSVASLSASSSANGRIEAVATVNANFSADTPVVFYVASLSTATPTCQVNAAGELTGANLAGGIVQRDNGNFSGLSPAQEYRVSVCVGNGYGAQPSAPGVAQVPWGAGPGTPTGSFAVVSGSSTTSSQTWEIAEDGYGIQELDGYMVVTNRGNAGYGSNPAITAAYCLQSKPTLCGPAAPIGPSDATRPYAARISNVAIVGTCIEGQPAPTEVTAVVEGSAAGPSITSIEAIGEGGGSTLDTGWVDGRVPVGTNSLTYEVDFVWTGEAAGIGSAKFFIDLTCSP